MGMNMKNWTWRIVTLSHKFNTNRNLDMKTYYIVYRRYLYIYIIISFIDTIINPVISDILILSHRAYVTLFTSSFFWTLFSHSFNLRVLDHLIYSTWFFHDAYDNWFWNCLDILTSYVWVEMWTIILLS